MPEKAVHRQCVLDAGALIADERRDRKVAALMEVAAEHRIEMILPSAVLAQVWRDGARQALLSRMLRNPGLVEAPLHHADAKRVGELLRDSRTSSRTRREPTNINSVQFSVFSFQITACSCFTEH